MSEIRDDSMNQPTVTDPPDAVTWEWSAVVYVLVMLAVLLSVHIPLELRGRMKWEKIRTEHVVESARPAFSTQSLCLWRFFCFVVVVMTDVVIVDSSAKDTLVGGGWIIFATFTIWSWSLIGLYMLLSGLMTLATRFGNWKPSSAGRCTAMLCRLVWLLFEVMLPVSFLIFLAVWLVLLPVAYQTTGGDMGLLTWPALFCHNLNFLFMFVEALVNRLCITTYHLTFMFYYGASYVIFSWIFFKEYHFFYFFIDWRYPLVLIGYTALLVTLTIFFFLGRSIVNCVKPPLYTWDLEESEDETSESMASNGWSDSDDACA